MNENIKGLTTFKQARDEMDDPELRKKRLEDNLKSKIIMQTFEDFKKRQTEKLPFELTWRLIINYLEGNQFLTINTYGQKIEETIPFAWWEEREVFNQLAPIFETRLAKLARVDTACKVRPATGEADDISSAKICTKIIASYDHALEMEAKQLEANVWMEKTGTAVFKTLWSMNKGRVVGKKAVEIPEELMLDTPDFEKELMGISEGSFKFIREGDADVVVCNPFEIYPDSVFNPTIKHCRSIIHARVFHEDELFEEFGIYEQGTPNNVFNLSGGLTGNGGIGQKGTSYAIQSAMKDKTVLVLEKWELPSNKYPNGRLIIVSKKNMIYYGKLPDGLMTAEGEYELPFDVQKSVDMGYFFGTSILERLLPLQRRYNSIRNRKKEYLNRVSIGQLVYDEGSIDEDMLEEDGLAPGQMIPVKQGFDKPEYLQTPPLPSAFDSEDNIISVDFNRISGVSEISRDSQAPTGVGSGIALSILKEQDDTRLSLTASNIGTARIGIAKKLLTMNKYYVKYPRQLKDIGKQNTIAVIEFTGKEITSNDVYIERTSALSETPAQRRQMVFDLLQAGLFQPDVPPKTVAKVMEMLELGNWESFDDDINMHYQKAKRENVRMLKGEIIQPDVYDEHLSHVQEHVNFMLTSDFEEMNTKNPTLKQVFMDHYGMHIQMMGQNQQQVAIAQGTEPPVEPVVEDPNLAIQQALLREQQMQEAGQEIQQSQAIPTEQATE